MIFYNFWHFNLLWNVLDKFILLYIQDKKNIRIIKIF